MSEKQVLWRPSGGVLGSIQGYVGRKKAGDAP